MNRTTEEWNDSLIYLNKLIKNHDYYKEILLSYDWVPPDIKCIEKAIEILNIIKFLDNDYPSYITPDPWGGICVYFIDKEITFHNDGEIEFFEPKR